MMLFTPDAQPHEFYETYIRMKKTIFIITALLVFATLAACKNQQKTDVSDNDARGYIVQVGDMAPDFEMELPDGNKVLLSALRGKVVMLQFTASWCGVCRKEMPHIEKEIWQKQRDNPDFALFGIDRNEPDEKIDELRKATGVTYPIGRDPNGDIFGLYAEKKAGITRNVIIDRTGKIVMLTRLYDEKEFAEMTQKINNLLTP